MIFVKKKDKKGLCSAIIPILLKKTRTLPKNSLLYLQPGIWNR